MEDQGGQMFELKLDHDHDTIGHMVKFNNRSHG